MEEEKTPASKLRLGDKVIRKARKPRRRLRIVPKVPAFFIFLKDLVVHTPVMHMFILLLVVWLVLSAGIYFSDHNAAGTPIRSYGDALYTSVAGFSTAGIAIMPVTPLGKVFCALMMVSGSAIFFGAIVAGVTAYFMRPLQRPSKQIISTIEYNLEQLEELSVDELELLKETADDLISAQIRKSKAKAKEDADN